MKAHLDDQVTPKVHDCVFSEDDSCVSQKEASLLKELDQERQRYQNVIKEFSRLEQRYDNLKEETSLAKVTPILHTNSCYNLQSKTGFFEFLIYIT